MRDFHHPGRSPVLAANGMAATSMPIASLTAIDVLRSGGNALDAAIAAVAVLGVVEPQSTGIGGDCFCLYAPAGQRRVVALNGSGRAPAAATIDHFERAGVTSLDAHSPHAVTIPGAVAAWETLLAAHGTRGLDELLRPATRLAEEGFPVSPRVALDWADAADGLRSTGAATAFLPGGRSPRTGERFAQPALARTLRAIASGGARAFYEGEIAADMVATVRARGGLHTLDDFAAGRDAAQFVEPISRPWRGMEVVQCPPNGSGLLVLMLLGLLEGFSPVAGPLDPLRLHRHLEAARLVYRDRNAFLADPTQADVPIAELLSADYLGGLRSLIRDDGLLANLPPPGALPDHRDTVTLSVVDRDGNACSLINSLFHSFGSCILAERSGVMLHNRGLGFRLERGHPNCIAPNKRPMHTIIPGMVMRDGEAIMPYGVMGGHFQPMGQSWFLSNHFEYGLDLQQSIDLPRVFAFDGLAELEPGVPAEAIARLAALGHDVVTTAKPHGGGQAVLVDRARGVLIGASDPRKDGCALGY